MGTSKVCRLLLPQSLWVVDGRSMPVFQHVAAWCHKVLLLTHKVCGNGLDLFMSELLYSSQEAEVLFVAPVP